MLSGRIQLGIPPWSCRSPGRRTVSSQTCIVSFGSRSHAIGNLSGTHNCAGQSPQHKHFLESDQTCSPPTSTAFQSAVPIQAPAQPSSGLKPTSPSGLPLLGTSSSSSSTHKGVGDLSGVHVTNSRLPFLALKRPHKACHGNCSRVGKGGRPFPQDKITRGPARRPCEMDMASNGGFTGLATISETHCPSRPAVGTGAAGSRQRSTRRTETSFPSALRRPFGDVDAISEAPFPAALFHALAETSPES